TPVESAKRRAAAIAAFALPACDIQHPLASMHVSGLYQALGHELQRVAHPRVVTCLPAHPLAFLDRLEVHSVRLHHDTSPKTGRMSGPACVNLQTSLRSGRPRCIRADH